MLFYETDLLRKVCKSVLRKDSMIFEIQGNTEIDRYFLQSVGEPPLNSGAILWLFSRQIEIDQCEATH